MSSFPIYCAHCPNCHHYPNGPSEGPNGPIYVPPHHQPPHHYPPHHPPHYPPQHFPPQHDQPGMFPPPHDPMNPYCPCAYCHGGAGVTPYRANANK
ncbi:hypothetical protein DMENIID0001_155230 [Sergentomyia squamirostris]